MTEILLTVQPSYTQEEAITGKMWMSEKGPER